MEYWVLTMLALENKLEAAAESCTRQAEEAALEQGGDAFSAFEKVIEINDKKRRIVNMKVLCDTVKGSLAPQESELLVAYVRHTAGELAAALSESRLKVYRDVKRALSKAAKALARIGFKKEELERDYRELALFSRTYNRLKRLKSKERTAAKPENVGGAALAKVQADGMQVCA